MDHFYQGAVLQEWVVCQGLADSHCRLFTSYHFVILHLLLTLKQYTWRGLLLLNITTMISLEDHLSLFKILDCKQGTVNRALEKFSCLFLRSERQRRFKVCSALATFLKLNLLTQPQRLLAIIMILEPYRGERVEKNPFGGIFQQIYRTSNSYERRFFADLLLDGKKSKYLKMEIEELQKEAEDYAEQYENRQGIRTLQKFWVALNKNEPLTMSSQVSNIVVDNVSENGGSQNPEQFLGSKIQKQKNLGNKSFASTSLRPIPSLTQIKPSDLNVMSPSIEPNILCHNNTGRINNALFQKISILSIVQKVFDKTIRNKSLIKTCLENQEQIDTKNIKRSARKLFAKYPHLVFVKQIMGRMG